MHKVEVNGDMIMCQKNACLRDILIEYGHAPHNDSARWLNCKGFGTCGTCAVEVEGKVSPMNDKEKLRLQIPPHSLKSGLRLACQVKVHGDIKVKKHKGFWGQHNESS